MGRHSSGNNRRISVATGADRGGYQRGGAFKLGEGGEYVGPRSDYNIQPENRQQNSGGGRNGKGSPVARTANAAPNPQTALGSPNPQAAAKKRIAQQLLAGGMPTRRFR